MEAFYLSCLYVLAGVLGLCVGSFLNVVIYRVPNGMSLSSPPSHCPSCKSRIRAFDNIPVLSYLFLGGKCRSCKTHIPFRYTAVELSNAVLWLLCVYMLWEKSILLACLAALSMSVFLSIFFIDLEHMLIFDRFQLILLAVGILYLFFDTDFGMLSHILGGVFGFGGFYLIAFVFEKLSGKEGLGGGDIKLAGVCGLMLGWERLLLSVLIATVPAAVVMAVVSRGKEGEEREFPFAPFLVAGFAISLLFGTEIIDIYLSLLGAG